MSFANKQLAALNKTLGGSIQEMNGDRIVQFSNRKGKGKIHGTELGAGMTYLDYALKADENLSFHFGSNDSTELYFIYCSKGRLNYSLHSQNEAGSIGALQTAILGGFPSILSLAIAEGVSAKFSVIRIPKMSGESTDFKDMQLNRQVFERFLSKDDRINYIGSYNLKIREQLKQIPNISEKGVVRTLLIKGIIHFTLALEIRQYDRDEREKSKPVTRLGKRELLRIEEASKEIETSPEYSFSVNYLSRKYALSPSKLQDGFKALHGTTVTNYIKRIRVEAAERLIKHSDMNISEVVYSVGFTSRSYFSKIFKKRYNCSPKQYQEHCNVNHLTTV